MDATDHSQAPSRVPVTVVTGFLGAGKSTLVERWLAELPPDTAVIVNEQGEVGIDGTLLAEHAARLLEINGGCVCCVTQAALDRALVELVGAMPRPSRILIETSGAASPAGVIKILTRGEARDALRLDGVVTVFPASRADETSRFPLAIEQLGFADVVVLSHADRCDETLADTAAQRAAALAPGAVVAQASRGVLLGASAPTLLDLLAQRDAVLRVPAAVSTDAASHDTRRHGIDAIALCHDGELNETRFGDWVEHQLGKLEARILRVKGILAVAGVDERVIVQGVGEAIEVTLGAPWGDAPRSSRFVILGLGLGEGTTEAELRIGFEACRVS